jgi:geranylgeranyl pyrophosphate synthase
MDMAFETKTRCPFQLLGNGCGKTASLLAAYAELGALCAGADELLRKGYRTLAGTLDCAFQALDDLLGIWGDEVELGKSTSMT